LSGFHSDFFVIADSDYFPFLRFFFARVGKDDSRSGFRVGFCRFDEDVFA